MRRPAATTTSTHAGTIFIAGSNTAYAHPIVFRRIEAARKANPKQKLIVVDPRRTDTAGEADLHLAILPGTDVALYHAMLNVMLWEELVDRDFIAAHTEGWEALREIVRDYTPEKVAADLRRCELPTSCRRRAGSPPGRRCRCIARGSINPAAASTRTPR